ncbi:MAG: hypothetical protein M3Q29_01955 [Chloroflexota bacterium]|nr:hypothetical protein [Chloroflexota bacterium]
MWRFYTGRPISVLGGTWAALATALAHALTRRRLPAALLTGALVALWPKIEGVLHARLFYQRLTMYYYRLLQPFYRFLYRRREREEEERYREEFIERYGFPPEEHIEMELLTLERVIPVAQSQRIDGGTLMVLSIDSYTDGCEVRLRLLLDEEPEPPVTPFEPRDFPPVPELRELIVHDDLGHRYPVLPSRGEGGGRGWEWTFHIHRPIDPVAHALTLEIPEIRWMRHEPGRGRADSVERVQRGPWMFRVAL